MRRLFVLLTCLSLYLMAMRARGGSLVPPDTNLYDRLLVCESAASAAVRETVSMLATQLEDMTGVEFFTNAARTSGPGIYLLRSASDLTARYPGLLSQQAQLNLLTNKSSEGFLLYSPGTNHLFIVGNSDDAVNIGAYFYLQRLGWRALLPGSNWTIKPLLGSIIIATNAVKDPSYRQRDFFGTGGFGGSLPLDPNRQVEAAWTRWKAANLFGGSVSIGGHAGEAFNTCYEDILQTNEAMRAYAVYPTSHVPYSVIMKPDASDPSLQDLYVSDRVAAYNPAAYAISVEPADGDGFCVCPPCTAHDPVSSQVFGLAKRVADALNAVHPGAMVSLYAYAGHAAVPADPILRAWLSNATANVYVNVIPYAFQRTGLTGDQLAAAWAAAKPNHRGIYDYWSIPDWSNNLPDQNLNESIRKLQYWAGLGYDGLASESTYSAGSVGLLWYMAGGLMFDSGQDPAALRQEFYNLAFGAAASPMQRMIERWGSTFTLTEQEIGNSFLDVAEARNLAANHAACLARVNDYARYVQYLRLYFEYQEAAGTNRHAAADTLLKHAWRIHDSAMVHAYRMNELIRCRYEPTNTVLQADWNPSDTTAAGWVWVRANPLTDSQLTVMVSNGVAAYATAPNHVPFEQPAFSSLLVPLVTNYTVSGQLTAQVNNFYGGADFTFYVKAGVTSLTFQFTAGGSGNATDVDKVWVYNPAGALVYSNIFGGNGVYGSNGVPTNFTVGTATSGNYTLTVYDPKKSFNLAAEKNLPFVLTTPLTSSYQIGQIAWFYVPAGIATLGLYAPGALAVEVRNANSNVVSRSFGDGIGESDYAVAANQSGKCWSMGNFKCYAPGAWPLNAPRIWSFSTGAQHGMLVPSNAAPSVSAGLDAAIVAPTNVANLNGTVTDDHLSPSPYWSNSWTKVSGPGTVAFGNRTNVDTTAAFSTAGVYVLRLTVNDTGKLAATDEVTVVYSAVMPNQPPSVDAGTNLSVTSTNFSAMALLAGTITDDGQSGAVTSAWTKVRGPGAVIFGAVTAATTSAAFDEPGDYLLRLTATDGQLTSYDQTTVTVIPDYNAPGCRIGGTGVFGPSADFSYSAVGLTFNSTNRLYSARFRALENVTVDQAYQRLIGVDSNTTVQIGIMSDDGNGNPSGIYLAATAPNYHPATGDSLAWATFTNAVALNRLQVYHLVTRATALGADESFMVYCSGGNTAIRPYDRAPDPFMNGMRSTDGGQTWTVLAADPYFTLGYGALVFGGPGNADQYLHASALLSQGSPGKALGQKFAISLREMPDQSAVAFSNLTLKLFKSGAAHDLIVKLRRGDGTVLGTITKSAAEIAASATSYTWGFDGGTTVWLAPGRPYFLTTEMAAGSGSGEYYYFTSAMSDQNTKANSWGGTDICVPVQSAADNNWSGYDWSAPALYAGRDEFDLWFAFNGQVTPLDSFDAWLAQVMNGPPTASACATGDGYPNLLKYATGSSPTNSDDVANLTCLFTNGMFAVQFHRNTNALDLTLVPEGCSAFTGAVHWAGLATNLAGSWRGATQVTESGSGTPVVVTVRDSAPLSANRYLRLRVTRP